MASGPGRGLSVRLPAAMAKKLKNMVARLGKSESEIVRAAIASYLEREMNGPTCYDVAKKAGILGCVRGGPDDLSVNPRHLEGFGRD